MYTPVCTHLFEIEQRIVVTGEHGRLVNLREKTVVCVKDKRNESLIYDTLTELRYTARPSGT